MIVVLSDQKILLTQQEVGPRDAIQSEMTVWIKERKTKAIILLCLVTVAKRLGLADGWKIQERKEGNGN